MTTRNNYPAHGAKQETRKATLEAVKRLPHLWRHDHLSCDWMELTAEDDKTLPMLLREGVLVPGTSKYIGINYADPTLDEPLAKREDASRKLLADNEDKFADDPAIWHYGTFEDACLERIFPRAGVIVFDTHYSIGRHNTLKMAGPVLHFFKHQVRTLKQAVLVLNVVYRGSNGLPLDKAIAQWTEAIADYLDLPTEAIPIHVYRSAGRQWQMVLTRLSLDAAYLPPDW